MASASSGLSTDRETTIAPTQIPGIARASFGSALPWRRSASSNTPAIAVNTFSKARWTTGPLRATSPGKDTIGQLPSTSSKCSVER